MATPRMYLLTSRVARFKPLGTAMPTARTGRHIGGSARVLLRALHHRR
jgi:hypothetical protein